ncbi:hypothetical protein ABW19_dt0208677 [Dactylella cylindrospora]|nr:hypothetical protein ABW19_dt0208677 [Dactylella cylindrospora]
MTGKSINDYTIGWICALQEEYEAAAEMLDEELSVPKDFTTVDRNTYLFGRVDRHWAIIGCLPGGRYGTNATATVATEMTRSFPNLKFALMVGIGGGAPTPKRDIRLGDVVVSEPYGQLGGVVQYDLGKELQDGNYLLTGQLNAPPSALLAVLPEMKRRQNSRKMPDMIAENIRRMDFKPEYQRPSDDNLYRSDYLHQGGETCENCQNDGLLPRVPRSTRREVNVHYGTIASGNSVMQNAVRRDRYANDPELNILCFDMAAAGLMNNLQCLVIRGICDYSDSHKNDKWHNYAAAAAAAYARELLHRLRPIALAGMLPYDPGLSGSKDVRNAASDAVVVYRKSK